MAPLVSCQNISKSHGPRDLFTDLTIALNAGDRIGLVGPNGAGKSTLLQILAGLEPPDSGEVVCQTGIHVGYVPQHLGDVSGTVESLLLQAILADAHRDPYERDAHIRRVAGELGFDDLTVDVTTLSGGWRRRLSMALALVKDPDLLLMDEPTNHLDLAGILWLEGFLQRSKLPFVLTSHDRVFLENTTSTIWEISPKHRNGFLALDLNYSEFIEKRTELMQTQQRQEAGMRSKMRREEEWLRQSPKARTGKSKSRIQEAARLKHELAQLNRRNQEKKAQISIEETGRQNKKLLTGKNLSKTLGGRQLFSHVEVLLQRGDRLGIVGENGSGKSTLLRILAGELESDSGTIKWADQLQMVYFDQQRAALDLEQPLRRGLAPHGDTVWYQGRSIHVNGWADRFLFSRDRLDLPMKQLSGGEKARVLIAQLMLKPADLLILDEPTNDLDIETLELLEDSLDDFPGAVILVTHDRAMMDRIADQLIAIDGSNQPQRFNDTSAWLTWRKERAKPKKREAASKSAQPPSRKLSYKEKRELEQLEQQIELLEAQEATLTTKCATPEISANAAKLQQVCEQLGQTQEALEHAMTRWQELAERE